jgi:hypothetical protein
MRGDIIRFTSSEADLMSIAKGPHDARHRQWWTDCDEDDGVDSFIRARASVERGHSTWCSVRLAEKRIRCANAKWIYFSSERWWRQWRE